MTLGTPDARPHDRANVAQNTRVGVAELPQQAGRVLDIRQQEGHGPARQLADAGRARLAQLPVEEPERNDAVLLGRPQQPLARSLFGFVALERCLIEPGQRIPNMRHVVDRQPAATRRVDIGEGRIGQVRAGAGVEWWH